MKKNDICLHAEQLGKKYNKDFWAVRDFSFELKPGVTGLLGPNGAGKSTLMRMLSTISGCSEGRIFWNGIDVKKNPNNLRNVLGYLPQDFGVYEHLNAYEFLEYISAIKGLTARNSRKRIEDLLAWVNLVDFARKPLGTYSGGMRQRVGIAQALLNDPQLLIVDEPTVGLDPEERIRFRQLIGDLAFDRIILLSTHIVSDIESIADRIMLMNSGKLLIDAHQSDMINIVKDNVWELEIDAEELREYQQKVFISSSVQRNSKITARIISEGKPEEHAKNIDASLEDAYIFLVNQKRKKTEII